MCRWTMGLNSDKASKVFCINICCFSARFYFFCTTMAVIQVSSKLCMFGFLHPIKQNVQCAVTRSIPRKRFCGRGVGAWYPNSNLVHANDCCTQTDRQHSEIWPLQFRQNRLTHPASRRPNFINIGWILLRWRLNDFQDGSRPPSWI